MLLSRAADSLYWISRYLERAEHGARLTAVAVDLTLGSGSRRADDSTSCLFACLGAAGSDASVAAAAEAALLDLTNSNSVASCVNAARENARQVREEISADMWEQINQLYLAMKQLREQPSRPGTHAVAQLVIQGSQLFQGITDATMGHGEGWYYLQAGRSLERASATATLIDCFVTATGADAPASTLDQVKWVALLRSCSALEAYSRQYTADVRTERVAEFLLLSEEFPRSVRFAAASLEAALLALGRRSGRRAGRLERLAGRLHSSLDYAQVDEILGDDPHEYLAGITRQCDQIHAVVYQTYIAYQIESALPA
jgi:uncharacterized alpha-E superfamily protein